MERRSEHRRLLTRRIEVEVLGEGETSRQSGFQDDESTAGVGVTLRKQIPVGTRVKVRKNDWERTGIVRNSRQDSFGYVIGIQFDTGKPNENATPVAQSSEQVSSDADISPAPQPLT